MAKVFIEEKTLSMDEFIVYADRITEADVSIAAEGNACANSTYYNLTFRFGEKFYSLNVDIKKVNAKLKPQVMGDNGPTKVKFNVLCNTPLTNAYLKVNTLISAAINKHDILKKYSEAKVGFIQTEKNEEDAKGIVTKIPFTTPLLWCCFGPYRSIDKHTKKSVVDALKFNGSVSYVEGRGRTAKMVQKTNPTFIEVEAIWKGPRAEVTCNISFDHIGLMKKMKEVHSVLSVNRKRPLFIEPIQVKEYETDKNFAREMLLNRKMAEDEDPDPEDNADQQNNTTLKTFTNAFVANAGTNASGLDDKDLM